MYDQSIAHQGAFEFVRTAPRGYPRRVVDRGTGSVVVAGHLCLDLIPQASADRARRRQRAGELGALGPMSLAVGGCVGNSGIALHRLGLTTTLVARVGDDELGRVLAGLVAAALPPGAARLLSTHGSPTSYSLITSRPGADRVIRHFTGVNDTFVANDVPDALLRAARHLHVGYPPLMAAIVADDGRELRRLLDRAHAHGLTTSVDMANANLDPGRDRLRWQRVLERVLPATDVFLPSLDEAGHLLRRRVRRGPGGVPELGSVGRLADAFLALGTGIAGIKLGEHGLYVRSASATRPGSPAPTSAAGWSDRELYSSVFESDVVGTTGAGDATVAGFLFGLLTGMEPDDAVTAATAVGGSSTEAADGTSAVPPWPQIESRLRSGWPRRAASPGPGWRASPRPGLWHGPRDAGAES